ncbi:conserved hypothetical protein [Chloroherpeton thalassium ATCC 35110]|uniref:Transferase hexapeptide repeat containing protein n=1 Tax=Chloroherpeton thalassium (strain ATCC 35110 / GB-78) TaxID=517418 RepID=B3QU39_CHLT3|nr:hypothetical protein [Chloroherpeton thalassium]ACF12837.1 conserved hypothetical protein [Chloroherpeton thalassium ATCC 35110]
MSISKKATIGKNVQIGYNSIIHDNVIIEDDVVIGDLCAIGIPAKTAKTPLHIGKNSVIRSHGALYEGSNFSGGIQTGHHVLIRENTIAGKAFRIGSFSDVEGDCLIGDHTSFHSYVHVGKGSKIGNYVWLYSLVTLTNDPLPPSHIERPVTIEDGAVVCVGSVLLPGAILKKGAFVAAGSLVSGEIGEGKVVSANGDISGNVTSLIDFQTMTRHPWMRHFADRYPESSQEEIQTLFSDIQSSIKSNKKKRG